MTTSENTRLNQLEDRVDFFVQTQTPPLRGVFYDEQLWDARVLVLSLVSRAKRSLILIDNWANTEVLDLFAKKRKGVRLTIFTSEHYYDSKHVPHHKISPADVKTFNAQYPKLVVRYNESFHDRFLIIDDKELYLIGASLKTWERKALPSPGWTQAKFAAWNNLGLSLLTKWLDEGDDVSLDHSVSCFLYAARKGHAKAQFNLAMAYFAGFRMQNCLRAVEWFRRSAENGEPWAMYVMGLMEGIVEVGKDKEDCDDLEEDGADLIDYCLCDEALVWFSRAALDILNHFKIPDREDFMRYVDGSFYDDSLSGWFSCKAEAQDFELRNGRIQDGVFLCRGILRSPCRFISKFGFDGAHGFAAYRLLWMSSHPRSCHSRTISISSNIRSLCRDTLQGMAYHGCCGGYYPVEDYSTDNHFISNGDTFIECLFAGMNNLYEKNRRRQHGKLKYYRYDSFVDGGVDCEPIYIDRALAVDEKDVVYTWVSALRKFVRTSWTRRHPVSNSTCISFRSAMRIMKQFEKDAEAVDISRRSLFVEFRRRRSPRWQSYAQWWREYCPFDNGGFGLPYLKRDSYSKARMCNLIHSPGIGDMSCEGDPEEDD